MRISDWSSDVCSSDLPGQHLLVSYRLSERLLIQQQLYGRTGLQRRRRQRFLHRLLSKRRYRVETELFPDLWLRSGQHLWLWLIRQQNGIGDAWTDHFRSDLEPGRCRLRRSTRSEEHTSELQSLMRISYAVFCLKKKKQ